MKRVKCVVMLVLMATLCYAQAKPNVEPKIVWEKPSNTLRVLGEFGLSTLVGVGSMTSVILIGKGIWSGKEHDRQIGFAGFLGYSLGSTLGTYLVSNGYNSESSYWEMAGVNILTTLASSSAIMLTRKGVILLPIMMLVPQITTIVFSNIAYPSKDVATVVMPQVSKVNNDYSYGISLSMSF